MTPALRWAASDESHNINNVSLFQIVRDKAQDSVHRPQLLKRKKMSKAVANQRPSAYRYKHTTLPVVKRSVWVKALYTFPVY